MKKKNEIVDENVEKVEISKSVLSKRIIIIILSVVVLFTIFYGGFILFNRSIVKEDGSSVDKNTIAEQKKDTDSEQKNDNVVNDANSEQESDNGSSSNNIGNTSQDEIILITDDMKKELNNIANIRDGYCSVERIFYNMNGSINDLSIENKKNIIINYYIFNNSVYDKINEAAYNEIAAKYSISDSFDTVMSGLEKVGNEYVVPPIGCPSPERVTHNMTYQDTGNTVTVIDNVTIINNETKESKSIKVIYTFVYSKNGNEITFRLERVNSEK